MLRAQQDHVVEEEEPECCPLCIEEFDLSDRGFHPCPCGYQICQFCYNNIKREHESARCPACRRPYDDKNIKWEAPSAEEVAKHKEGLAQQAKRKAAAKHKEAQKREADSLSRKHLAGIRVRRQNLVYVTGLRLNTSNPQLNEVLRSDQYFGQYGKIDKIVVNKPKDARAAQPVGVYITYFDKDSAKLCIESINGSQNNGSTVRADYGTTKYCSAYLRNETCTNKNCTFLHEAGDESQSFTRQEVSSLNAATTQSSASATALPPSNQATTTNPPHPYHQQSNTAERRDSTEDAASPVDSSDGSALPSTASWAARNPISRRASQGTSLAASSPQATNAIPVSSVFESSSSRPLQGSVRSDSIAVHDVDDGSQMPRSTSSNFSRTPKDSVMSWMKHALAGENLRFSFDEDSIDPQDLRILKSSPLLFDPNGGTKRLRMKRREEERLRLTGDQHLASQTLAAIDMDESGAGGSYQLGGDPEDHQERMSERAQDVIQRPSFGLDSAISPTSQTAALSVPHSATPQQHYLLQQLKSASPSHLGQEQHGSGQYANSSSLSGLGHGRQTSRFSFANDSASASTFVKPVANSKILSQQASMMPPSQGGQYTAGHAFSSGVQGPPPGLKTTGTPPVSGGGMFGKGHGFATAGVGYGFNSASRNSNDEMMRELLRNRGGSGGPGPSADGNRRELLSSPNQSHPSPAVHVPSLLNFSDGPYPGAFQDTAQLKHKRKGRKHRHANTSSSGGGVVDHADPSMLQARMPQGGNDGSGVYGTQSHVHGHGGYNSSLYGNNGYGRW